MSTRDEGIAHAIEVIRRHSSPLPEGDPRRAILADVATELACGSPPGVTTYRSLAFEMAGARMFADGEERCVFCGATCTHDGRVDEHCVPCPVRRLEALGDDA